MEIIIDKKTYVLKPVNQTRRELFVKLILPYYANDDIEPNQLEELSKVANLMIWEFIKDEDKKYLGIKEDLDVEVEQLGNFINFVSDKIKNYAEFIKLHNDSQESSVEKIEAILSFVAEKFGWTFDYMQEMDELTFLKALQEACKIDARNSIKEINQGALVGAFSSGSKQAKRQIDEINRRAKSETEIEKMGSQKVERKGKFLTEEELRGL